MHDCLVTMKDGRRFCGPVWEFKPEQGYLTIPSDEKAPSRIFLRDIATAITSVRTSNGVDMRDLVQVAREKGWDGT